MNIIILEDKKGFRREMIVPRFTPTFRIAERPRIEVYLNHTDIMPPHPVFAQIEFFPHGEPEDVCGTQVMLYKEM